MNNADLKKKNSKNCTSCPFFDFSGTHCDEILCRWFSLKILWMVRFFYACFCLYSSSVHPIQHDAWRTTGFLSPLCFNSRIHCPLLQSLHIASVILAGTHFYKHTYIPICYCQHICFFRFRKCHTCMFKNTLSRVNIILFQRMKCRGGISYRDEGIVNTRMLKIIWMM